MNRKVDTRVWECAELVFKAGETYDNPFLEVELHAEFIGPDGQLLMIPGFWDGGNLWKVRFAPVTAGEWHYTTICSDQADAGLHGHTGLVTASEWQEEELQHNPNRRGFVRIHASGRWFEYGDGTPFYWIGDTLWSAHTMRCDLKKALPTYLEDRRQKGFNVIQLVVGHPTADQFGEETSSYVRYEPEYFLNEGGAPYLERYTLINPAYFSHLDLRIRLMLNMGFVPCLMAMWGQDLQGIKVEGGKRYLRYLVARYAAYNVMWSPAGEYLFTDDVEGWRELGEEIHRCDPYGHPTSVHSVAPHSGSRHYHAEDWYDFNLIQVGHVLGFKNFMEMLPYHDYQMQPPKPSIMSESWYENHPNCVLDDGIRMNDKHIRFATYVPLLQGCIGQTYGAHGIWSLYNGEQKDRWTDQMRPDLWWDDLNLPGSGQMKHVRDLMETVQWWELEPHPEWASTVAESNVYCAAILRQQYIIYCTGGQAPVPVLVMIMGAKKDGETYAGQWMNPRTGEWHAVEAADFQYHGYGSGMMWRTFTPDQEDWILSIRRVKEEN
ncbi:DUF4038 domain-containing protein [Paenibacillus sp. CF384]|uniref:apiosidase-like domain-containing protein n=1 Tax=Paenibacillus sp. CF384 TaxID=1884382 RepID=UPI0008981E57|nr:DUF4038 domain-containing protein [Paenibacillus sp. CF384]SDX37980.1 protein of unknown function [Paenibacillus sp. CF384]